MTTNSVQLLPFHPTRSFRVKPCSQKLRESTESVGLSLIGVFWFGQKHLLNCYCKSVPDSKTSAKSQSVFKKIITHLWAVPLFIVGLPLYLIGNICLLARSCSTAQIRYSAGRHKEVDPKTVDAFHLNGCSLSGSLPLHYGKCSISNSRIDAQIELYRDHGMVLLSEISPQTARYIMSKTKRDFAHFFYDMGSRSFCLDSGLFFATKYKIEKPSFIPFSNLGKGVQKIMRRGFFVVRCGKYMYYFTHLESKSAKVRLKQLVQIKTHMGRSPLECIIIGDLNIDSQINSQEHSQMLDLGFDEVYPKSDPTYTNFSTGKKESIDYVLVRKGVSASISAQAVNTSGPSWAISDHSAMVIKV